MAEWTWARSKDFITKLQEAPIPPVVVPAVPYPEEEGSYGESRYYSTATSQAIIDDLLKDFLSFLGQSKEAALMGRDNGQVRDLAVSIIKDTTSPYDRAKAIHEWVYENVEYRRTPYIIPPWELIRPEVSGDCKSFAVLVASLLGVANIPCWFKLAKIGGVVDLHIYDLASLTWAIADAVGAYFGREVNPVAGYVIYEIDRTSSWPPRPLPSGSGIYIPEKLKEAVPYLAIGGGVLVAVALALLTRK